MVNVGIRSEELCSKFPSDFYPICGDLSRSLFPVWNRIVVVVDWSVHSPQKSTRINFRCNEARVLGGALGECAVNELALAEFRCPEIAATERRTRERDVPTDSSPEHTAF